MGNFQWLEDEGRKEMQEFGGSFVIGRKFFSLRGRGWRLILELGWFGILGGGSGRKFKRKYET